MSKRRSTLGFFIVIIFFVASCSQSNYTPIQSKEVPKKVNLCDEIAYPTAEVSCQTNGCYISVSGDGRVKYLAEFPNVVDGVTNQDFVELSVGQKMRIGSKEGLDYVRITPYKDGESMSQRFCKEKSVIIGRSQFT